jgi:hypothetical protein
MFWNFWRMARPRIRLTLLKQNSFWNFREPTATPSTRTENHGAREASALHHAVVCVATACPIDATGALGWIGENSLKLRALWQLEGNTRDLLRLCRGGLGRFRSNRQVHSLLRDGRSWRICRVPPSTAIRYKGLVRRIGRPAGGRPERELPSLLRRFVGSPTLSSCGLSPCGGHHDIHLSTKNARRMTLSRRMLCPPWDGRGGMPGHPSVRPGRHSPRGEGQ